MSVFPPVYSIGASGVLTKWEREEIALYDKDPRGILWIWEPPFRGSTYVMGLDPSNGRTGWNRWARTPEDRRTDNGAIEIVRIGRDDKPDVQVAEFAAPVDAFEIGIVANLLGRLYSGTEEDQCKCIIEVYPGPGTMTLRTMIDLGYTNHFQWERYGNASPAPTTAYGWHASAATCRDLWAKSSRHLVLQKGIVRSPWLAEEYANCRYNVEKQWGENPGGHDDRVRAFNLALWLANSWALGMERTQEKVSQGPPAVDWQLGDGSLEDMRSGWADMWDRMSV